ncbi:hypothetical protein EDM56_00040 [Brevibacillus fluminis]|uniref:Uncharacterized protein n=1 Tax=Brevibacillus fluminis TaxID=511487 RepID=A0A3M8DXC2_9BACL|nr:hypothetical protein EDM56_00040 [Brevibacillus fluminis]
MLERLDELKEKAKGTIFEAFVDDQVENYKQIKQKELKKAQINNKWIDQADKLFNLFEDVCNKYKPKIEAFASQVVFVDNRDDEGSVSFAITNFKSETFSLQCADLHSLNDDYQKLEDDEYVETLDVGNEVGGVHFFFYPGETIKEILYSETFTTSKAANLFTKAVEPLILELFQKCFDLESLLKATEQQEEL